jgi:hypothetical protein
LGAYLICVILITVIALIVNAITGPKRLENQDYHDYGDGAFDEFMWMIFCTFHGMSFGDYHPIYTAERIFLCLVILLGYYFVILTMSIVMLSQLAGEPEPTLFSTPKRIFKCAWPMFLLKFLILLIFAGIYSASGE